ncbi:hypothetical protein ACWEQL_12485 [Kitasatospora sp. NPDC004240]
MPAISGTPDLVDHFRRRAWWSLAALAVLAFVGLPATHHDARTGGTGSPAAPPSR